MDAAFWHRRWATNDTGFHQPGGHDLLPRHIGALGMSPGGHVLVPLCGKSRDMYWLASAGYRVTGIELSETAADQFFAESGLRPVERSKGPFVIKSAGNITIWCGDVFAIERQDLPEIDGVFDRAALIALPPDMQPGYGAKLASLVEPGRRGLLIAIDYDQGAMDGPPFSIDAATVQSLLGAHFEIHPLETRDALPSSGNLRQRGLQRVDETIFSLVRRP